MAETTDRSSGVFSPAVEWTPPRGRGRWQLEDGEAMVAALQASGETPGDFARRGGRTGGARVRRRAAAPRGRDAGGGVMLSLSPTVRVFVVTAPCDLRKQFDGLAVLVEQGLHPASLRTRRRRERARSRSCSASGSVASVPQFAGCCSRTVIHAATTCPRPVVHTTSREPRASDRPALPAPARQTTTQHVLSPVVRRSSRSRARSLQRPPPRARIARTSSRQVRCGRGEPVRPAQESRLGAKRANCDEEVTAIAVVGDREQLLELI